MRLTHELRHKIVMALLKRGFDGRDETLRSDAEALGDRIYRECIPADLEKALNSAEAIMPGAVRTIDKVRIKIVLENNDYEYRDFPLSLRRPEPYIGIDSKKTEDEKLANDLASWVKRLRAIELEKHEAAQQSRVILEACNSLRQLEAAWPDVMSLVRELLPEMKPKTLPAVPVADLNQLFELPPEKLAEAA